MYTYTETDRKTDIHKYIYKSINLYIYIYIYSPVIISMIKTAFLHVLDNKKAKFLHSNTIKRNVDKIHKSSRQVCCTIPYNWADWNGLAKFENFQTIMPYSICISLNACTANGTIVCLHDNISRHLPWFVWPISRRISQILSNVAHKVKSLCYRKIVNIFLYVKQKNII